MTDDEVLGELLSQWEQGLAQGREQPAAELCRDRTDLIPELERRIHAVRQGNQLAQEAAPTGSFANDESQPQAPCVQSGSLPSLPGYEVLGKLGEGGMGVVYKARDVQLDRVVALKMVQGKAVERPEDRARFLAEARAVARVHHPNIVQIYQAGEQGGRPFISLEFVEGPNLAETLKQGGPWPARRAAELVARLAGAVEHAHRQGIIHRDLKPSNVLLAEDGTPKVTDFGLARRLGEEGGLTQPGQLLGTPEFMSPEQAEGRPEASSPSTDVFGLGAILYQVLTGRPPYRGDSTYLTIEQAQKGQLTPPREVNARVPRALERICLKAMVPDPRQRYPSAAALEAELRHYLLRRRRWGILALGLAAGTVLLAVAIMRPKSNESITETDKPPLKGLLDVLVWEEGNPQRQRLGLRQAGALPMKNDDRFQIQVELNRPAFTYLVWIDSRGVAVPVYPWEPGEWKVRPDNEQPVDRLILPSATAGYKMGNDPPGMHTLLLLCREEALPREVDLEPVFADLPRPKEQNPQAAVWFRNGEVVHDESERAPEFFNTRQINDPVLRTQALLKDRLQEYFSYTRAVSFAGRGR